MTDKGNFKSAFTCAEGWGSFEQKGNKITLDLHYGKLSLKTLSLRLSAKVTVPTIDSSHGKASVSTNGKDTTLTFKEPLTLAAGDTLTMAV